MTGLEHFLGAEQLAEEAHHRLGPADQRATAAAWAAVAQVHATLAVAAAIDAPFERLRKPENPARDIGPPVPDPWPRGPGPLPWTSAIFEFARMQLRRREATAGNGGWRIS